jgi:hypothetical protein
MTNAPSLLTWPTHEDALARAQKSGALEEVQAVLRAAYQRTARERTVPLRPASVVEKSFGDAGWQKAAVWTPESFEHSTRDSFDAWKAFEDDAGRFGVAVEVEWVWERWFTDFFKFWRAARGGQIALGFEILYGRSALDYVVQRQYALYADLFADLRVVFCALDAPDLLEPGRFVQFGRKVKPRRSFLMP